MNPPGQPITGAAALPASRASSPPEHTATTWAPAAMAAAVASSVSSVPPEYDTAKNRVCGPTNRGARYCLRTVTGTARSWEPAVASTSPEMPEPPIPQTATLVIPGPGEAAQVDRRGRRQRLGELLGQGGDGLGETAGCRSRRAFRVSGVKVGAMPSVLGPGEERLGVARRERTVASSSSMTGMSSRIS